MGEEKTHFDRFSVLPALLDQQALFEEEKTAQWNPSKNV
jgi:hypothetical protein